MAIKLTKRKGFNFFRSYFDVYNELETDSDKVAFMDALLERQFLGKKPNELKGMSRFAYISQTNSIDSQVKGYEDKTKTRLDGSIYVKDGEENSKKPLKDELVIPINGAYLPPAYGVSEPPAKQVEEKEKEKEKDIYIYSESDFLKNWESCRKHYLKLPTFIPKLEFHEKKDFDNALKDFSKEQINQAMRGLFQQKNKNIGSMYLKPKHFLENISKYLNAEMSKDYELYGKDESLKTKTGGL